MELKISGSKNRFILKEALVFTVAIKNGGAAPIQVPATADNRNQALTYELSGPSVPAGLRFHYGPAAEFRLPGDPQMTTLAPGATQEDKVDVVNFVPIWTPGKHKIRIRLQAASSPDFEFEIVAGKVKSAQVLSEGAEISTGRINIAFLENNGTIYLGFYSEADGTVETPAESYFVPFGHPGESADASLLPWTNFNRGSVFFSRYAWLSGGVFAIQETKPEDRVTLPLDGASIAGPPLMVTSGVIQLFTFKGNQASLWSLPRTGSPTKSWTVALPGVPIAAGAALGSKALGSPAAAVFVIPGKDELILALAQDGKIRQHKIEKHFALPKSVPAVALPAKDAIHVSLIAGADEKGEFLVPVEVIWHPDQKDPSVSIGGSFKPVKQYVEALSAYSPLGNPPRRDWVVALEEGEVISSRSRGVARKFGDGPVLPLQLAPRSQQTFLLVHKPAMLLDLEILR